MDIDNECVIVSSSAAPERLSYVEKKVKDGENYHIDTDYTDQFLELVKEFPVLYDEFAEMRRYRSKDAWKEISEVLGRFSVGKLRAYWAKLMRQYKLSLEKSDYNYDSIFHKMTFVNVGISVNPENTEYTRQLEENYYNSRAYLEEDLSEEEHLTCEEIEEDSEYRDDVDDYEETAQAIEHIETFAIEEPALKKIKIDPEEISKEILEDKDTEIRVHKSEPIPSVPATIPATHATQIHVMEKEDEFDYFGKKVALQLRDLAQKNRIVARKGEIKVLQLLLELEESLET